ncbi:hypothetical protein RMN56_05655 [Micromonospora halotolerans]|uniref:Serine/threonine protein kinase n=1 Tax=Micromonospora halotolerans TaxID=709879 RepID=A0ABZ0A085_9ACTN|nr:hypothetical protein [Micromonospora halotolerans]WNM40832.1 hypothetical protein RMN56_05655 [Micromonospora halotolerans]
MAEDDELTQTGIRVGGWLPAVPAERARAAQPPPAPRRLPGDPDAPLAGPADPLAGPDAPPVAERPALGEPDAPPPVESRPAAPVRHSAPEGVTVRLAGLVGPAAAKVRAAVGVAPDRPTRVGVARARRRRRRMILAGAALTALVLVLAYAGRGAEPDVRPTVPAAAPTAPAPTAAPPTVVPVTGNPALPGGPLLNLDQEPVPPSVSLTVLGSRDWLHWGGTGAASVQRKQRGTGEIGELGGDRLEHNAGAAALTWTDGTPTARQDGTRSGVFQRGAGKSFALSVAGSGDLRTVRLFVGAFSAGARLDVRLSGGGDPAVREVALAAGDRFFQYVVHFRAPRGQRLLITWRALTVVGGENDGVTVEAVTVS